MVEDINNFINGNYKFSGSDIVKAFDMAATHSLYLDGKRVDPSTFGKFLSRASVGKILTAYKESKQGSNARPSGYNYNQLQEAKVNIITPEEAHDLILKWISEDGKLPEIAPYIIAYKYLVEKKQIKSVEEGKKKGRTAQMFGGQIEISHKRQAAELWYSTNAM